MPRFFYKEAAGTPVRAGSDYVYFEVVGHSGGSIQGVTSLSDELAAIVEKIPGVTEIKEDEYLALTSFGRNRVSTRGVDSLAHTLQQPVNEPIKVEPIKVEPRAVVKLGKA